MGIRRGSDKQLSLSEGGVATYKIDQLNQIVLISRHIQMNHDIRWLSNLQHLYTSSICILDLFDWSAWLSGMDWHLTVPQRLTFSMTYVKPINYRNG